MLSYELNRVGMKVSLIPNAPCVVKFLASFDRFKNIFCVFVWNLGFAEEFSFADILGSRIVCKGKQETVLTLLRNRGRHRRDILANIHA